MRAELEGLVAVVTGAGLGIGRAIALTLAAQGAKVVIGTRTRSDGEATLRLIKQQGGEADLFVCDVGYQDQSADLISHTTQTFGALDILVHNAGYFPYSAIQDLADDELERVIAVNLKACFWLSKAALPALERSTNGRILVTSSVSGNHANAPGLTHYSTTKAGVTGFVRNLALDLAPQGITVNAVEPGFIVTERNGKPDMAEQVNATAKQIPMRRCGKPIDIANLMTFLASPEANYITGQSIVVDGGLTLGTISGMGQ